MMIRKVIDERGSYGYRRTTALVNRQLVSDGKSSANHKRVYRVMREHRLLLERHTGKPRRIHDGVIITLKSNLRWCSDSFEIRCWNGARVNVAFSLDTCDREAMSYLATITRHLGRDDTRPHAARRRTRLRVPRYSPICASAICGPIRRR
jgi:putative transposase